MPAQTQNQSQQKAQTQSVLASGLTKKYGATQALAGLDLEIPRGQCLALLGPNGAGKSTTIKILAGMIEPDSGSVQIFGKSWKQEAKKLRQSVGLVMQETHLYKRFTTLETLKLFHSFYANPRSIDAISEELGLTPLFGKQIGDLSGGQKQLVHLASTLLGNPSFLLLDEPTVGLDIQTRKLFWDYIEKYMDENGTVFLATHYIEEAQRLATHLSVLSHGKTVAHGPVAEVVQKVTQNSPLVVELSVEKEHKEAWIGSLKKLGLSPQKSGEHILWPTEKAGDELGKVSELAKNIAGFEGLTLKKPDMEQAYNQLTHTKSPST